MNSPIPVGPLAVWTHKAARPAGARVLVIHGLSEHSGRHLNTVNHLVSCGFEVVRFDLRGSGLSGGRRQWIEKFEHYVEDVSTVFHWMEKNLDPMPLFVLGHSLGGAIAIYYAAFYPRELEGLLLSSPAYIVGSAISPLKILVGKAIEPFFPTLPIPNSTDYTAISRDKEVQEAYRNDPLCVHFNTLRQGNEILKALENIPSQCRKITVPTLMAHGSLDRVIKLEGSYQILQALGTKDRTLHILPGVYHEPHNDFGKENYFDVISAWLSKQMPS